MEAFRHILLDVWREACRHTQIAESTANIAQILAYQMPLSHLIVQNINQQRSSVETIATAGSTTRLSLETRTDLRQEHLSDLLLWLETGAVMRIRNQPFPPFVPEDVHGDILAGPLKSAGGLLGIVLLVSPPGEHFEDRHQAMLEILLEPFSVALEIGRAHV